LGKEFYIVVGRLMDNNGEIVDWFWLGKLKYWDKNIIEHGCYMDGWVWRNSGKVLTAKLMFCKIN